MAERKAKRERKKVKQKQPPQVDSLDRAADSAEQTLKRPRRTLPPPDSERKWTVQQEIQLLKKRSSCLAHKWMHYRMAHLQSLFANLLGFPLVVISAVASAILAYDQLQQERCSCSSSEESSVTAAGIAAIVFSTLVTILTGLSAWLKPAEAAEIHRQVSITYQSLVDAIEDEMATKEEEREDGRFFMHDIGNKMEMLGQTGPTVFWFIMRNYTTDWADEREREIKIEPDAASESEPRLAQSTSFRLERIDRTRTAARDEEDDFNLMENFRQRLQTRLQQEQTQTAAHLQYQLQRAQEHENE